MAKIIKVASSTSTPRIANQFRTSRNSTTNPFKYQDFEGNTLDISAFADVFESSTVKDTGKMKLIAASVAGSMHKIRTNITEPIIRFVSRVCEGVSSAWDYAKNTNVSDIGAIKSINSGLKGIGDFMNKPIHLDGIVDFMNKPITLPGSGLVDNTIEGIKSRFGTINESMLDWGKDISSKWSTLISKIHSKSNISSDLSVSELENLWKAEIASANYVEAA